MGVGSGNPLWSLLVVGNLISLAGFGVTLYQQQLDRLSLRELQLRLELAGEQRSSWTTASGQERRSGAGPGDPEPGKTELGRGVEPAESPRVAVTPGNSSVFGESKLVVGLLFGLVVLVLVLITGLVVCRWTACGIEESETSPTEKQRRLAQRQLAELRLRRHGFGG